MKHIKSSPSPILCSMFGKNGWKTCVYDVDVWMETHDFMGNPPFTFLLQEMRFAHHE